MVRGCGAAAAVAVAAAAFPVAIGCGMEEHTSVAHRALSYYGKVSQSPQSQLYNDLLQKYPDSVLAGADFPDFLYACGTDHDAGEAAHWPPWQATAVNYTRTFPDFAAGNLTGDTEEFMAFVFGVSVHYIADELWEGLNGQLGNGQGFVRVLSAANLNGTGTTDNNEGPANMAGDFHMSFSTDQQWLHPWQRQYPLEKILEVYHLYGKPNVTLKSLETCKAIFDLGLWAEQIFGKFLFIYQSSFHDYVPFVAEHDLSLPIGGIDDMAVWSTWVWERVARWFDDGAPPNPSPNAGDDSGVPGESYVYGRLVGAQPVLSKADAWLHSYTGKLDELGETATKLMQSNALSTDMFELVDVSNASAGIAYTGPEEYFEVAEALLETLVTSLVENGVFDSTAVSSIFLTQSNPLMSVGSSENVNTQSVADVITADADESSPLAYTGSSLAVGDFNGDKVADIAVGSYGWGVPGQPQVGRVNVQLSSGGAAQNMSTLTLQGSMTHSRFGWDLAVLDFNDDGIDDLCVSAPTASWNNSLPITDATPSVRFWGLVECYFGHADSGLSTEADYSIRTTHDLTGLGMTLRNIDIDGDGQDDLVIGAPMNSNTTTAGTEADNIQKGLILGFRSGSHRLTQTIIAEARSSADLLIDGPSNFGWFGEDAAIWNVPSERVVDASQAVSQSRQFLLVGSPFFRTGNGSVGRVYAYEVGAAISWQTGSAASPPVSFTITGVEHAAEFGKTVAVVPNVTVAGVAGQTVLSVSAPATGGPHSGVHLQAGCVHLLSSTALAGRVGANTTFDIGVDELSEQSISILGGRGGTVMGRLGFSLAAGDVLSPGGCSTEIISHNDPMIQCSLCETIVMLCR